MKKVIFKGNEEVAEIIENNGIDLIVNENMDIIVSDDVADQIVKLVAEQAEAATMDVCFEDIEG